VQDDLTVDLNLTTPGYDQECLNGDDNPWGTYTYDLLVMEYDGATPAWVQADAIDWQFLKRYRDGYHLWVPENLPSPHDDEPGHKVWIHPQDGGPTEHRAYLRLHSEDSINADMVEIVTIDPELREMGSVPGPTGVDITHGAFDGLLCYSLPSDSAPGRWRTLFTARDAAGHHSGAWRPHSNVPMLVANGKTIYDQMWRYEGPDSNPGWNYFAPALRNICLEDTYAFSVTPSDPAYCNFNAPTLWSHIAQPPRRHARSLHTNTHGRDSGSIIEVTSSTDPETPGGLAITPYDTGGATGYYDGQVVNDGEMTIAVENVVNNERLYNVHFWMVAACNSALGNWPDSSVAQGVVSMDATVAVGFTKRLVDSIEAFGVTLDQIHGTFMRMFYEECGRGSDISTSLTNAITRFKPWVEENVGKYENTVHSTEYYGYDTGTVKGQGGKQIIDTDAD